MDANNLLPPLLSVWARIVSEHPTDGPWTPWWLDPAARTQSIIQAAKALGWQAGPLLEAEWDLQLNTQLVMRCVGAGVDLGPEGKKRDVIADAWRYLSMTSPPPRGTQGVHVVFVEPHLAHAGDEADVRSAMATWRATHLWPNDGTAVWVDSASPMPRNSAGTAFPGLGLIARWASPGK
jgi:hypothetical protein